MTDFADAVDTQTEERIGQYGYTLIAVFDPDEVDPPFTYTVGLSRSCHPELILVRMNPRQASSILGSIAEAILRDGPIATGKRLAGFIDGYDIKAVPVPNSPLAMARHFYGPEIKALQILWPDTSGVLPGETGFDETYAQPYPELPR
jgi:hypothetical protein